MAVMAALNWLSAAVITACNSLNVFTPLPSAAVDAMAAKMALRLSAVTPVKPKAAKRSTVNAEVVVVPAAVAKISLTVLAKAASLDGLSTSVEVLPSTTSLRRLASLALLILVAPSNWYCAAVNDTSLSTASPSARAMRALTASTTA